MIRLALAGLRRHGALSWGMVAGVALTTALLVGGLAMGDGLRAALAERTARQVGPVRVVVQGPAGGLRTALADGLAQALGVPVAPVIARTAIASPPDGPSRSVTLLAGDARLATMAGQADLLPEPGVARMDAALADALGVTVGDRLVLRVERPSSLTRDAALTRDEDRIVGLSVEVGALLDGAWPTDLSTDVRPGTPDNVLVDLDWLGERLAWPGRAERVLVGGEATPDEVARVTNALDAAWALEDGDLTLGPTDESETVLSTSRVLLPPPVVDAALAALDGAVPASVWFADGLRLGDRSSPYAFVVGVDPAAPCRACDGLPDDLGEDEVVLSQWMADDLGAEIGAEVVLRFPVLLPSRGLDHHEAALRVREVVPVALGDRAWMPPIEGLSGKDTCQSWDPGLPVDLSKIRDEDEAYWAEHGGTPKAWVRLDTARRLWATSHGFETSVRWDADADAVRTALRGALSPAMLGLSVDPLAQRAVAAERPANDFGALFGGFQFVLLVSALLLTSLQASFGVASRVDELGTLRAIGWPQRRVLSLLGLEGALLATAGVLLGLPMSLGVAAALREGLAGVWSTATTGVSVPLALSPTTALGGGLAAWGMAWGTVWGTAWWLGRGDVRAMLSGATRLDVAGRARWAWPVAVLAALVGVVAVATTPVERNPTAALLFFGAGFAWLLAGLGLVRVWLDRTSAAPFGAGALSRRPARSMAVVGLLSLGTFLVAGVGLGGGRAEPDATARASGSGGFAWFGQTAIAVHHDLSTEAGREALGLPPADADAAQVVTLSRLDGDDASCLQLGSAVTPTLLGVDPEALASRGAFALAGGAEAWRELVADPEARVLPAIGDESTLTWGLHLGVGDVLHYVDADGEPVEVRLVGVMGNSVFQGSLLVDRRALETHWPAASGSRTFLVEGPGAEAEVRALDRAFTDLGGSFEPTPDRLHRFTAVEDTYIAIFRALGGLGLVLGALGVGLVLARGVRERQGELALLRAIGFPHGRLVGLLVREHLVLLVLGTAVGALAAAVAVLPVLRSPDAAPPLGELGVTLGFVALSGVAAILLAARLALSGVPLRALAAERR